MKKKNKKKMNLNSMMALAVVIFTICSGWALRTKAECEQNYDSRLTYGIGYKLLPFSILVDVAVFVVVWINENFLTSLGYLLLGLGVGAINGWIVAPFLTKIIDYRVLGARIPIIAWEGSLVFLVYELFQL